MKDEQIRRLELILERELSDGEKDRMNRIKQILGLADDDVVWEVIAAMEFQRSYYDELPQKIAAASAEIVKGISAVAEKEVGRAQSLLAESVAEQAKKMSLRLNMETLLPMGLAALVCLLVYGSLSMWVGFSLGSGHARSPEWLLRMPSGFLIAGLCAATGLFLGAHAGREFAEDGKGWLKKMFVALVMLISGSIIIGLAL